MEKVTAAFSHGPIGSGEVYSRAEVHSFVDIELDVWRDPRWLNRAQISAQDLRAAVLVSKVDGPDTSAIANIEDPYATSR